MCLGVGVLLRKHALPLSPQEGSWGLRYALGKKTASLLLLDIVKSFKSLLWVSSLWVASDFQSLRSRMEMTASA